MANATVEKLKAFGLRQGEKFVVGIAAAVLLLALVVLVTSPTLSTTPDELQKKADAADSNLRQKQEPEAILAKVEEDGIVDPGFVKIVDNQTANAIKPADFHSKLDWVTPEPGAGLIRDQPELIAPTELLAFPGRGGTLLYVLDDKGDRIPDPTKVAANGMQRQPGAALTDATRKNGDAAQPKRLRSLAGSATEPKAKTDTAKAEEEEEPPAPLGPFKEDTFGKRWVVVTGIVDNELLNKNWLAAVKNPALAYPQYVKVGTERQIKQSDGSWSGWTTLDDESKYAITEQMPEADEELVPLPMRPETLVDPLPFLRAGYWTGVHVARLVPAELRNAPTPDENPSVMRSSGRRGRFNKLGSGSSSSMGMGMGMGMGMPGNEGFSGGGGSSGSSMSSGMGGSAQMSGMYGGSDGSGGGQPEEAVVANTEPTLMIRSVDYTVQPNSTYRYRVRLEIKNPNYQHTDVNPGVDTTSRVLNGPWSDPTTPVAVPSDVSIYAQVAGKDPRRDDVVNFQVYRWDPAKGETVVKTDDAGPGFLVGEYGPVQYPSSEGTGPESKAIDFNSRSFVLDATGGDLKIPDLGVERNLFSIPAMAMVVEPDGGVVLKNQSRDAADEVRKDMDANYRQALDDSGKKREPTGGSGMMGSSMSGPG